MDWSICSACQQFMNTILSLKLFTPYCITASPQWLSMSSNLKKKEKQSQKITLYNELQPEPCSPWTAIRLGR